MPVPVRQSLPERGLDGWSAASKNLKNIAPTLLQSAAAPGFLGQLFGWQQDGISDLIQATPIATKSSQHLPQSFFARPAEQVDSPGFGDAASVMSASASSIAITPKEHLSATGAQGC